MRHSIRIPFFTRATAENHDAIGPLYCANISEGGLLIRAPEAPPDVVKKGASLGLSFVLPDPTGGPTQLAKLLGSDLEVAPPVIYIGPAEPPQPLQQQISGSSRVAYLPDSAPPFALHVLARRLIEFHVLARENEHLTAEVERSL